MIKVLSQTVEGLNATFYFLQNELREKVNREHILNVIVYAIEDVKEID